MRGPSIALWCTLHGYNRPIFVGKRSKKDWFRLSLVTLTKFLTGTHTGRETLLSWCCRGYKAITHINSPSYILSFSSDPLGQCVCHQSWNVSLGSSDICAPLPSSSLYPLCSFMFLQKCISWVYRTNTSPWWDSITPLMSPPSLAESEASRQGWSQFRTSTVPGMSTG